MIRWLPRGILHTKTSLLAIAFNNHFKAKASSEGGFLDLPADTIYRKD
jgi:hypothetical protein